MLGGSPGAPEDWRIDELQVAKGVSEIPLGDLPDVGSGLENDAHVAADGPGDDTADGPGDDIVLPDGEDDQFNLLTGCKCLPGGRFRRGSGRLLLLCESCDVGSRDGPSVSSVRSRRPPRRRGCRVRHQDVPWIEGRNPGLTGVWGPNEGRTLSQWGMKGLWHTLARWICVKKASYSAPGPRHYAMPANGSRLFRPYDPQQATRNTPGGYPDGLEA